MNTSRQHFVVQMIERIFRACVNSNHSKVEGVLRLHKLYNFQNLSTKFSRPGFFAGTYAVKSD